MAESPILGRIERELEEIRSSGLWRSIPPHSPAPIDLSTNSYLALHSRPEVARAALDLAGDRLSGNLASRLVGTPSSLYERLEEEIALWKAAESALVFNSGYAANAGVFGALCGRGTEVFCDRLDHASILDGVRLSGAEFVRYGHNDLGDLRDRLSASRAGEKIIAAETVFSMDGDLAPLADLCDLADRHACLLAVDEAHAAGVFGRERASGLAEEAGCESRIDVRIGTLSKAAAGAGGFFAGPAKLRDYLVNRARSLIFSTGLPHAVLAWDLAAVSHIRRNPAAGRDLLVRSTGFREKLRGMGFDPGASETQIIPLIVGGNEKVMALSRFLLERGIKAPAIRSPAVPRGTERLRFSVHAGFDAAQEERVLEALREWKSIA
jgi:8-amino-7-oxononanoate synthase